MVECDFCDKEFDSEKELHLHWGEEHEDELNSHQQEKVEKAERKDEEESKQKKEKRKRQMMYGVTAVIGLALVALIGPQLLPEDTSGEISLENQPVLGNPNASVTVVEFGDYKCPFCKRFEQSTFPKLKSNYIDTGKIKFSFVNFAFLAPGSEKAAVAAECVYNQNKTQYWDYHHAIYENQGPETEQWVTTELLMKLAKQETEGLNYEKLKTCINSQRTIQKVNSDRRMGQSIGVSSTPSIVVNGELVNGNSYEVISKAIEDELN